MEELVLEDGQIGMLLATTPPGPVVVKTVVAGLWADSQGIQAGARIIKINGRFARQMSDAEFKLELRARPVSFVFDQRNLFGTDVFALESELNHLEREASAMYRTEERMKKEHFADHVSGSEELARMQWRYEAFQLKCELKAARRAIRRSKAESEALPCECSEIEMRELEQEVSYARGWTRNRGLEELSEQIIDLETLRTLHIDREDPFRKQAEHVRNLSEELFVEEEQLASLRSQVLPKVITAVSIADLDDASESEGTTLRRRLRRREAELQCLEMTAEEEMQCCQDSLERRLFDARSEINAFQMDSSELSDHIAAETARYGGRNQLRAALVREESLADELCKRLRHAFVDLQSMDATILDAWKEQDQLPHKGPGPVLATELYSEQRAVRCARAELCEVECSAQETAEVASEWVAKAANHAHVELAKLNAVERTLEVESAVCDELHGEMLRAGAGERAEQLAMAALRDELRDSAGEDCEGSDSIGALVSSCGDIVRGRNLVDHKAGTLPQQDLKVLRQQAQELQSHISAWRAQRIRIQADLPPPGIEDIPDAPPFPVLDVVPNLSPQPRWLQLPSSSNRA